MATHAAEFSLSGEGVRFLWTLHAVEGRFDCKVWQLTPADFDMLIGPGASLGLISQPAIRAMHADRLLSKITPASCVEGA